MSDSTEKQDSRDLPTETRNRRLTLVAILIGVLSLVGSVIVGYFAYTRSANVILQTALINNLNLARGLAAHGEAMADDNPLPATLHNLNGFWTETIKPSEKSFLCVVGTDGQLLLNTVRPEKVGINVGATPIPAAKDLGVHTFQELVLAGKDWSGRYTSHAGDDQLMACVYAPTMKSLIAVYVPFSSISRQIRAASLPWAIGWGIVVVVLLPASLTLLLLAFQASQRARDSVERRLRATDVELRRSRDFFSIAFHKFPMLVWRSGLDAKCSYFNQTWLQFTGRSLEQELGEGWVESVHPDDRSTRIDTYLRAFKARKPFSMEYRLHHHTGEYRWINDWGQPLLARDGTFEGYIGACQDITARKRAADDLLIRQKEREETNDRLRTLSRRLMETQEAEKHHLARELHDEIGQVLTVARLNLQAVRESPDSDATATRLDDSIKVVDRLLEQVRDMSLDLRPPLLDDLGLKAALRRYVNQQARRAGIPIRFLTNLGQERFTSTIETTCFRVAQEAVTNIIRHAQAKTAQVEVIHEEDGLRLTVTDNGTGFDVAAVRKEGVSGASFGLMGIEERMRLVDGQLIEISSPGAGTQIVAVIPLKVAKPTFSEVVADPK